jgi:hypothetical protein
MPRANLKGQAEVAFLRETVRTTFESQANRTLVANTNKGNYIRLAEEISEMAHIKAKGTSLERMDLTVSDGQVRSLFIESNKDFLDYFVQACYLYTQGIGREEFLSLPENSASVKTWEQENGGKQAIFSPVEATFQQDKSALEIEIGRLQKKIKQFALVAILALCGGLGYLFFISQQNKNNLKRLNIWSGNIENIEKDNLLPYLDFLKPESGFLAIVDTMIQSLQTPSVFHNAEAILPIVSYKKIVATSGYKKYGNSFYPDQISIIPIHGFSAIQFDSILTKTQGMASYLYTRYSHFALQNGETHVSKDILAKIMQLDDSDFDVDLIYMGYKQDIDSSNSDDFVLRYPPYKFDESGLQNYVMTTRQWWQEAINKRGIHWVQNFGGRQHNCGISKPYPTVRINAPNQRTFWVELSPDAQNAQTRMVLAIDLILKWAKY